MSTDLTTLFGSAPTVSKFEDEKALASVMKAANFLPRFQLYTSSSGDVKRGNINMAHFGIAEGKTIIDLGKEVVVIPLAARPCAIRLLNNNTKVLSYYDIKNAEFQKIQLIAESGQKDTGCMFGPQFLLWVPSVEKLAIYHMNNPTARREALALKGFMMKKGPCTIRSKYIDNGTHSWHGPECLPCSTPIVVFPDSDMLAKEWNKFCNPESAVEEAAPEEATGRDR
jgi:hypothetical protein